MSSVKTMSTVQTMDCSTTTSVKLTRVNYFNRQLLTADDMTTERDYFLQKLRRHNRFLHGWGVVCGLTVTPAPTDTAPWRVQIGSGYALGPYGDEIFIGETVYFDLAACITGGTTSPCEPNLLTAGGAGTSSTAYLAIKYAECLARPVQVASSGCGCDTDPCQYSRIVDSFVLQCMPEPPAQPPDPTTTLCQANSGTIAACPPCPTNPWVLLAAIKLPPSSKNQITAYAIDTKVRRILASTAVLQAQVVACCCKQQPNPDQPPQTNASLKSILVRASAVAGNQNPTFVGTPASPAGDWTDTPPPLALVATNPSFDFELVLTGPAPSGGFPVTVTAVATVTTNTSTKKPSVSLAPGPYVVDEGETDSPAYIGNKVTGVARSTTTVTITATAVDDPTNVVTATVTLPIV
jgi:hypothetical protein